MEDRDASQWLLLVDDDEGIQDALTDLLRFEGYTVKGAINGKQALQHLRESPQLPAVILLDLMMPVMDGFEFRTAQLNDATLADIPVLVLTAGLIDARVHQMQADGYMNKPVDVDRLLEDLSTYFTI